MGNTLKMEKQQQIKALIQLGWSDRAISRQTHRDRETVAKYRFFLQNPPEVPTEENQLEVENPPKALTEDAPEHPPNAQELPPPPPTNSPKLLPYIQTVRKKYLGHLDAQRIYQDLVEEHSYTGSYDSVKRYVRKLKKKHRRYSERLPHYPGREAQVDFGKAPCHVNIDGRYKKVWFFKMTLSCSKHAYEELMEKQDMETFLQCHENAFTFFGGVPEIVTLDNVKAGVLLANLYDPILNQTYLSFATHWGFAANACIPRKPEHKGVVERDVGYTKHSALYGRKFESLEEGNAVLRQWNKRWARTRIHGTTKCQVWKLFCDIERPVLKPLAKEAFLYFKTGVRKVGVDGLIEVDARYYAVPPKLITKEVIVHFNSQYVKVFQNGMLVITHRRLIQKGKVSAPLSCKPEWKHPTRESQERYYLSEARKIGPSMHTLVYEALSEMKVDLLSIRRVRGYLSLPKMYGSATVEEAAHKVLKLHVRNFHILKNACEAIDLDGIRTGSATQRHELIRPLEEYETIVSERSVSC
jgi:transposase